MKKIQKDLHVDLETTGTVHHCHGIIQLAAICVIDNKVKGVFNEHMRPFKADYIDPIALEKQNLTVEEIKKWQGPKKVYRLLIEWLSQYIDKYDKGDKFTLFGYNVDFDVNFLSEFFKKNDDPYFGSWQNYRAVCTLALVRRLCRLGDPLLSVLPDLKLETVTGALDIKHDDPHDALSDIRASRRVEHICSQRLKEILK